MEPEGVSDDTKATDYIFCYLAIVRLAQVTTAKEGVHREAKSEYSHALRSLHGQNPYVKHYHTGLAYCKVHSNHL